MICTRSVHFFQVLVVLLPVGLVCSVQARAEAVEPCEVQTLTSGGGFLSDAFGRRLAASGNALAVGAPADSTLSQNAGAVHVYRGGPFTDPDGPWRFEAQLFPSHPRFEQGFGHSADIEGDVLVVGAPGISPGGGGQIGEVWVFRRVSGTWTEEALLVPSGSTLRDRFGWSVSISGDRIATGAPGDPDFHSGTVYVFAWNGSAWVEAEALTGLDTEVGDRFGASVSLDGDALGVGADLAGEWEGAAYVFRHDGSSWAQEAKFRAIDPTDRDHFGEAVALSGEHFIVGVPGDDPVGPSSGSVYTYRFTEEAWELVTVLVASDASQFDVADFGERVATDGERILVGSWVDDTDAGFNSGSAYLFDFDGQSWHEVHKFLPAKSGSNQEFGLAVTVAGSLVAIGAPAISEAYVYSLTPAPPCIPAASTWGLGAMFIGTIVAGGILLRRRGARGSECSSLHKEKDDDRTTGCDRGDWDHRPPPPPAPDFTAPHHPSRVLVRFQPGTAAGDKARSHRAAGGGRTFRRFHSFPGLEVVDVPAGALRRAVTAYNRDPNVLYAEPDYRRFPDIYCGLVPCIDCDSPPDDEDPLFDQQWGLGDAVVGGVQAEHAWCFHGGWTGDSSFRIAVIDSGVKVPTATDPIGHVDLNNNVWENSGDCTINGDDDDENGYVDDCHGWNVTDDNNNPSDESDNWHGTHVAGILGAVTNNSTGVAGVNWVCDIVAIRMDNFFSSEIVAAVDYVVANDITLSNNSYSGGGFSQSEYDAIKDAGQQVGHLFVASAGNNGNDLDTNPVYPAAYDLPNIISVAATDYESTDSLATFEGPPESSSNYGLISVDLGAPGDDILSTVGPGEGDYEEKDGTSMAAPHVTGVAALVWTRHPSWTWRQVRDRVLWSVREVQTDVGTSTATGGVLDALAAVWDCNANDVKDETDISQGTSNDCTSNGTPDECEPDCNSNGTADSCDIFNGTSHDCQGEFEAGSGTPDECDISSGISEDCDADDVPDECEPDCDGDGIIDDCDSDCCTSEQCPSGEVCCNGSCRECCDSSDCPSGEVCCTGSCEALECCTDADCTEWPKLRCRPWDNTCVQCYEDSHCGGGCCTTNSTCAPFGCGTQGPEPG